MNLNETNIMSKSFPLIAYKTNIKVEVNQKITLNQVKQFFVAITNNF